MYTVVIGWNTTQNNNVNSYAQNTTPLELIVFLTEMYLVLVIHI
jgi:hypothetical protein